MTIRATCVVSGVLALLLAGLAGCSSQPSPKLQGVYSTSILTGAAAQAKHAELTGDSGTKYEGAYVIATVVWTAGWSQECHLDFTETHGAGWQVSRYAGDGAMGDNSPGSKNSFTEKDKFGWSQIVYMVDPAAGGVLGSEFQVGGELFCNGKSKLAVTLHSEPLN